jgi:hypothetical protein
LHTPHLISSSNAVIDCENLSFNIGSTNGNLTVENLAKDEVARLRGHIYTWSGYWTNTARVVITNNYRVSVDTNGVVTNAVRVPLTNFITVRYHAFMLDAAGVATTLPVKVYDFVTHSTNVVMNDNANLVQNFFMDGKSFTLNGTLLFTNVSLPSVLDPTGYGPTIYLSDWVGANAPNLLYFTNNGTLTVPNEVHFGDDRAAYASFVNNSNLNVGGINLSSTNYWIGGSLVAAGPMFLQGATGQIENCVVTAGGVVWLQGDNLKFNNVRLTAAGPLYLDVAGALLDAGPVSSNTFACGQGFSLLAKPTLGDLLGTAFHSAATTDVVPSPEVNHSWAGLDRGDDRSGYLNNAAIGKLKLTSSSQDPTFVFSGAGIPDVTNGLYVDLLDLGDLANNYNNWIQINPDLVIYFAAARVGFIPPFTNGVAQSPEEYLDGQFGGHLRWVRSFAGPNSSVDVVINGRTVKVNKALRESKLIDSDGDGIPNYYDSTPFGAGVQPTIALSKLPPEAVAISWEASPNTIYRVDAVNQFLSTNWQTLLWYTNNSATNRKVSFDDTNAPRGRSQRYYRVGVVP